MENNTLMTEEQLREQNRMLVALVGDLATILDEVLTALPPEFHELPNVKKSMNLTRSINMMLNAMPKDAPQHPIVLEPRDYMSGRWRRRDGDVYGIVRQPGVRLTPEGAHAEDCKALFTKDENDCDCRELRDANNPPGDLRFTD